VEWGACEVVRELRPGMARYPDKRISLGFIRRLFTGFPIFFLLIIFLASCFAA
jgi:hypothetical protein